MKIFPILLATTLASTVYARTDLQGCISSQTHNQWNEASTIWYVPGTGEICDIPDCGGGRAPPKHDNPACPGQYTGTATYEPSYLPGASTTADAMTTSSEGTATATATGSAALGSVVITSAPSMTASATATMQTSAKAGNSSSAASTSSSAGVTGTGNGAGMLELNVIGAVAAAALAVAAL
ncbi:hypothetical protein CDV55_101314 [Aspergillus turcosus]|uniref:Siderophore biosynthesis enzyme n=1 Tax=Aspergillus turcosus TaxID=1245748 RepID=A0A397HKU5_9EURO|nr:hypothetical protein CDV55_101314 [Aspergillus turcosus]RLL98530.1 hypothetical protein CFD26_107710 [Aspergillus turcosus]